MRKSLICLLILSVCALVACAPAGEGGEEGADAATENAAETPAVDAGAELRDYAARWQAAYNAGDVDGLTALYAADAVRFAGNSLTEGSDAIREQFVTAFENNPGAQIAIEVSRVEDSGDFAHVQGSWTFTATPEGATEPMSFTGKFLGAYHRQADGSWVAMVDASNADTPPAQEGDAS